MGKITKDMVLRLRRIQVNLCPLSMVGKLTKPVIFVTHISTGVTFGVFRLSELLTAYHLSERTVEMTVARIMTRVFQNQHCLELGKQLV